MSETYTPKHLRPYKRPDSYAGPDWYDYYPVAGRSRESDTLELCNFAVYLRELGGESDTVLIVRDWHWAVGWVETLYVAIADTARVKVADDLRGRELDYPILDEGRFSEMEWESAAKYWESMCVKDRVEILSKFGLNPFAARRAEIPNDPQGYVYDYLTS